MIWHQRSVGQQRPAFGTGVVAEGQPLLHAAAFVSGKGRGGRAGVTAKGRGGEGGRGGRGARESICGEDWVLQQLHGEVPECAGANEAGAGEAVQVLRVWGSTDR